MLRRRVSYEKVMRDKAAAGQKGLYTLDLINASKTPGKFGCRMTLQGPIDEHEYKAIGNFMVRLIKMRQARHAKK